jgi:hypothetical protein
MRPETVAPEAAHRAVAVLRQSTPGVEVDDETLAVLIEHGIDAVPPSRRADLLRAIGNSPDLALVVAQLAPLAAQERAAFGPVAVLGLHRGVWRTAWAACAILAVAATVWTAMMPPSPAAPVQLLDGGVDGPTQDFADNLHQTLRRVTVIGLWVLLALLTVPALLAGPRTAGRVPSALNRPPRP